LATAIGTQASPGEYLHPSVPGGNNSYARGLRFDALIEPEYMELEEGGPRATVIRAYGQRKTAAGLFNFRYALELPSKQRAMATLPQRIV